MKAKVGPNNGPYLLLLEKAVMMRKQLVARAQEVRTAATGSAWSHLRRGANKPLPTNKEIPLPFFR